MGQGKSPLLPQSHSKPHWVPRRKGRTHSPRAYLLLKEGATSPKSHTMLPKGYASLYTPCFELRVG